LPAAAQSCEIAANAATDPNVIKTNMQILALALLAGLLGLLAGRYWFAEPPPARLPAAVAVGDIAAPISYVDLQGQPRTLARGAPVLVNFWATWCAPCIDELPLLAALHERHDSDGIAVLAIALDDADAVADFLARHSLQGLPVGIDTPGSNDASVRLGNARGVLPFSVLLDAQGRILRQHAGPLDAAALETWVAAVR